MTHISLARQVPEAGRLFQLAARAPFLPVREVGLALTATPEWSLREQSLALEEVHLQPPPPDCLENWI